MNLRPAATAALLAVLATACTHVVVAPPPPTAVADGPMTVEDFDGHRLAHAILAATNNVREAHQLRTLGSDPALEAAAEEQAAHMAFVSEAEHSNPVPQEHDVAERVEHEGVFGGKVAENVIMEPAQRPSGSQRRIYTYMEYAAYLVDAWMNSPHHRANILNPDYTFLGCAAHEAHVILPGDERVYAVQVFLKPARD